MNIQLPNGIVHCERCSRFCEFQKFEQAERATYPCPVCGRRLANGDSFLVNQTLPEEIIDRLPESVCREILSIGCRITTFGIICFADVNCATSIERNEMLRHILRSSVYNVHADSTVIMIAIDRYYGSGRGY